MSTLAVFAIALGYLCALALAGWLLSVAKRDVSIVDGLWSLFFLLAATVYYMFSTANGSRSLLVLILVAVWAIRLSAYVTWRNWGEDEDARYQMIRRNNMPGFTWKSLYLVFGLQAVLAWVISTPLLIAIASDVPLTWLDGIGFVLWLVGLVFEAGGDWQLARFKSDPDNRGQVMNRGLWRYTRHPNYFGDCCLWWGFYCYALSAGGWWSVFAPGLMTLLLLRVSGVTLLEKNIAERRPAYSDYVATTNAFLPGPPRTAATSPRKLA